MAIDKIMRAQMQDLIAAPRVADRMGRAGAMDVARGFPHARAIAQAGVGMGSDRVRTLVRCLPVTCAGLMDLIRRHSKSHMATRPTPSRVPQGPSADDDMS